MGDHTCSVLSMLPKCQVWPFGKNRQRKSSSSNQPENPTPEKPTKDVFELMPTLHGQISRAPQIHILKPGLNRLSIKDPNSDNTAELKVVLDTINEEVSVTVNGQTVGLLMQERTQSLTGMAVAHRNYHQIELFLDQPAGQKRCAVSHVLRFHSSLPPTITKIDADTDTNAMFGCPDEYPMELTSTQRFKIHFRHPNPTSAASDFDPFIEETWQEQVLTPDAKGQARITVDGQTVVFSLTDGNKEQKVSAAIQNDTKPNMPLNAVDDKTFIISQNEKSATYAVVRALGVADSVSIRLQADGMADQRIALSETDSEKVLSLGKKPEQQITLRYLSAARKIELLNHKQQVLRALPIVGGKAKLKIKLADNQHLQLHATTQAQPWLLGVTIEKEHGFNPNHQARLEIDGQPKTLKLDPESGHCYLLDGYGDSDSDPKDSSQPISLADWGMPIPIENPNSRIVQIAGQRFQRHLDPLTSDWVYTNLTNGEVYQGEWLSDAQRTEIRRAFEWDYCNVFGVKKAKDLPDEVQAELEANQANALRLNAHQAAEKRIAGLLERNLK